MSDLNDSEYYAARAAKALALAEAAKDPAIANIHRRMAAGYSELAELAQQEQREEPMLRVVKG